MSLHLTERQRRKLARGVFSCERVPTDPRHDYFRDFSLGWAFVLQHRPHSPVRVSNLSEAARTIATWWFGEPIDDFARTLECILLGGSRLTGQQLLRLYDEWLVRSACAMLGGRG